MEEVTDEPLYRERVCDIGKAQMLATIRVPPDEGRSRRMQETRTFGTTRREVQALAERAAVLAGARCGHGGHRGLLEAG